MQKLFHIFRNTPFGRETFLQSIYFCNRLGTQPIVYIPEFTKFLMYFANNVVQVDLDESYLTAPHSAKQHVIELLEKKDLKPSFLIPKNFTASTLPDIQPNFDFMCCPRSVSDLSSRIGLGHIGPKVRNIINAAKFPILITSPVFKKWNSITVFFGGSSNALKALKLGLRVSRESGLPLEIFTQVENKYKKSYQAVIDKAGLTDDIQKYVNKWHLFKEGKFEENLYQVPHDALVVMGAFGHGLIREIMFGSTMETIQSTISNNLLIAGPNYTAER